VPSAGSPAIFPQKLKKIFIVGRDGVVFLPAATFLGNAFGFPGFLGGNGGEGTSAPGEMARDGDGLVFVDFEGEPAAELYVFY